MVQSTASGKAQCPRGDSHAAHYWRYDDEPKHFYMVCDGMLLPVIDVYERTTNGSR